MDDAHLVVAKPKEPAAPVGGDHWQARLKRHVLHEDWFTWNNAQKAEFLKTEARATAACAARAFPRADAALASRADPTGHHHLLRADPGERRLRLHGAH